MSASPCGVSSFTDRQGTLQSPSVDGYYQQQPINLLGYTHHLTGLINNILEEKINELCQKLGICEPARIRCQS
jgi:hypothetical protein